MRKPRMTYPKWMNDALDSDLGRELERREAAARAEQQLAINAVRGWLERFPYPTEEDA